jgi:hypothetical protein
LRKEKIATKANKTRVEEIERKIISIGIYPKDPIVVGDLIKKKDTDIKVLKKRLNIPKAQHVQTREIQVIYKEKEKLFLQLKKSHEDSM